MKKCVYTILLAALVLAAGSLLSCTGSYTDPSYKDYHEAYGGGGTGSGGGELTVTVTGLDAYNGKNMSVELDIYISGNNSYNDKDNFFWEDAATGNGVVKNGILTANLKISNTFTKNGYVFDQNTGAYIDIESDDIELDHPSVFGWSYETKKPVQFSSGKCTVDFSAFEID